MARIQPTWHGPLVNGDGTLSKPFIDFLRGLSSGVSDASAATDLTALTDRVDALEEGDSSTTIHAGPGITITGDAASGFTITLTNGAFSPLVAQIFGS